MERYFSKDELSCDLNCLDNKMKDIQEGNSNIIKNSVVNDLEESMKKINTKVRNTKIHQGIVTSIKNVRLFGNLLRLTFPYIIATTLAFLFPYAVMGDIAFLRQECPQYAYHEVIMDDSGAVEDKITYKQDAPTSAANITVTTGWELNEDGKYYRKIEEYGINKVTIEKLQEIFNETNYSLSDFFGEPTNEKIETRDDLSKEELEQGRYTKITYQYGDRKDEKILPQDAEINAMFTILYVLLAISCNMLVYSIRFGLNYSYLRNRAKILEKYKNPDMQDVMRQFREKKKTFEVMKQNNFQPILEVERDIQKTKVMK